MDEHKPQPILIQKDNGKFENMSSEQPVDVNLDQLKRENMELKEKLSAIRAESEVKNRVTIGQTPSMHRSKSPCPVSGVPLPARCVSPGVPCVYNPHCLSKSYEDLCDRLEQEYFMDMYHRYPEYYNPYHHPYHPAALSHLRAKSCDDLSYQIAMEEALLYNQLPVRRPRSRTRSVDGYRPSSAMLRRLPSPCARVRSHSRTRSFEDLEHLGFSGISLRCDDDPYVLDRWRNSGVKVLPFRPRTPLDISIGMKVSVHRSDGRISRGVVRWVGLLPHLPGEYLGVELETQTGKHDGYLNGIRYFKCRDNCGIFVKFTKVIMAWR